MLQYVTPETLTTVNVMQAWSVTEINCLTC